ncbi:MAG: ABC transporter substrate-binding protein [Alphaproteobacteria bacterium]|nr:ABC transporter substrate-binding protein [Alphaproteobacteria bacterium]
MKKKLLIIIGIIAIVIAAFFAFRPVREVAPDKPVIKIGIVLPLTGNFAHLGVVERKAAETAVTDINKKCADNCKYYYKLLVEDFGGDNKVANNAAKMLAAKGANALVSYTTNAGKIISIVAAEHNIAHFNCSQGQELKNPTDLYLNMGDMYAKFVEIFKQRNIKSTTLLLANIGNSQKFMQELLPQLDRAGIKYHLDLFNTDEKNFSQLVAKVKNDYNDEVIVIDSFEPAQTLLTREILLQKITKPVFFADTMRFSRDMAIFEGMYNIGGLVPDAEFQKHIGLKSGDNPGFSNYIYDMISALADGFEKTETTDGADVVKTIRGFGKWRGIDAEYKVKPSGEFESSSMLSIVKDGKMEPVK